jgi:hypothetical protein
MAELLLYSHPSPQIHIRITAFIWNAPVPTQGTGLPVQSANPSTIEHFSSSSITKNQSRPTFCQIPQIANHIKPISIALHSAKAITKLFPGCLAEQGGTNNMTSWSFPHAFSWGPLSNYVWMSDAEKLVSHCVNLSNSGVSEGLRLWPGTRIILNLSLAP